MSLTTPYPRQISFPGQAAVAEGPHDQTGMYMMHHAFRRDLGRFVAAVQDTPLSEVAVWTALARRWSRYDEILHHHHQVEDVSIWPVLLRHVDEAGDSSDRATLEAMEAEHSLIDPSLQAARDGFENMISCPCETHRNELLQEVGTLHAVLGQHLAHEESEALPILQRTVSVEEYAQMEAAAKAGYPAKLMPFFVPWVMDGMSPEHQRRVIEMAGRAYLVLYRLTRGRYDRATAVAFRHV